MQIKPAIAALCFVLLPSAVWADDACDAALKVQAASTGLPASLAQALTGSLALGPGGKMYSNAVHVDGKVSIETSQSSALNFASRQLSRGARDVRVGCLGVSISAGQNDAFIRQALDPSWNVRQALGGISSGMGANDDIGAPLAAIVDGSPRPADMSAQTVQPQVSEPPRDLSVGQVKTNPAEGSIKATWGLFNDRRPGPLSNP